MSRFVPYASVDEATPPPARLDTPRRSAGRWQEPVSQPAYEAAGPLGAASGRSTTPQRGATPRSRSRSRSPYRPPRQGSPYASGSAGHRQGGRSWHCSVEQLLDVVLSALRGGPLSCRAQQSLPQLVCQAACLHLRNCSCEHCCHARLQALTVWGLSLMSSRPPQPMAISRMPHPLWSQPPQLMGTSPTLWPTRQQTLLHMICSSRVL